MAYCTDQSDDSDTFCDTTDDQYTIICRSCGSRWVDDDFEGALDECPFCE